MSTFASKLKAKWSDSKLHADVALALSLSIDDDSPLYRDYVQRHVELEEAAEDALWDLVNWRWVIKHRRRVAGETP